jgi:hypothetical protein
LTTDPVQLLFRCWPGAIPGAIAIFIAELPPNGRGVRMAQAMESASNRVARPSIACQTKRGILMTPTNDDAPAFPAAAW